MKQAAESVISWLTSTWGKLATLIAAVTFIINATISFVNMQERENAFKNKVMDNLQSIDSIGRELMQAYEFSKVQSKLNLKVGGGAYYVTDSIGQTIEMSDEATNITGWPVNDLMGYKWHSHIPEPQRGEMLKYMSSTLMSKTNFEYTYIMNKPDNSRVKIKTFADRVSYPNQPHRTKGYVGVILRAQN